VLEERVEKIESVLPRTDGPAACTVSLSDAGYCPCQVETRLVQGMVRCLVWCAMGVGGEAQEEIESMPSLQRIAQMLRDLPQAVERPRVAVICLSHGAQEAGKKLSEEGISKVIWLETNLLTDGCKEVFRDAVVPAIDKVASDEEIKVMLQQIFAGNCGCIQAEPEGSIPEGDPSPTSYTPATLTGLDRFLTMRVSNPSVSHLTKDEIMMQAYDQPGIELDTLVCSVVYRDGHPPSQQMSPQWIKHGFKGWTPWSECCDAFGVCICPTVTAVSTWAFDESEADAVACSNWVTNGANLPVDIPPLQNLDLLSCDFGRIEETRQKLRETGRVAIAQTEGEAPDAVGGSRCRSVAYEICRSFKHERCYKSIHRVCTVDDLLAAAASATTESKILIWLDLRKRMLERDLVQMQSLLCDQLAHIDADVTLTVSDYNVSGLELINIEGGWEAGVHAIEAMGLEELRAICERELVQIDESEEPEPEPEVEPEPEP
jgi:hypothetical protein